MIEPQILDQWFVKMAPLAERALAAVDAGKIKFVPDNYEKIFRYWMSNTIDWNISRQIVWGIPVPAKICTSCDHAFPDTENTATACPKCAGSLRAETDTFDTWFSSGQWPLLSLGYSTGTDWKKFHPTDVMETGHDLIFKWVPRMVIFSLYLQNEVPFHTVYLHGLVNDAQGRKMSKSKGNVINPIDIIEKYGTDALRMALVVGNTPGTDMALAEPKIKGYKNFANKIWNIARFVKTSAGESELNESEITAEADKALIDEFKTIARDITGDFDNYRFHLASEKMYHYAWHRFADQILEESKAIINGTDAAAKLSRLHALLWILKNILIVLHPFMPFVTEELWAIMGYNKSNLLIVEPWPIED